MPKPTAVDIQVLDPSDHDRALEVRALYVNSDRAGNFLMCYGESRIPSLATIQDTSRKFLLAYVDGTLVGALSLLGNVADYFCFPSDPEYARTLIGRFMVKARSLTRGKVVTIFPESPWFTASEFGAAGVSLRKSGKNPDVTILEF